jgi:hypothetical protein
MYGGTHVCMEVHMYVWRYTCMYGGTRCTCMHGGTHVCMEVHMYVWRYALHMYVWRYTCMHGGTHVCMEVRAAERVMAMGSSKKNL